MSYERFLASCALATERADESPSELLAVGRSEGVTDLRRDVGRVSGYNGMFCWASDSSALLGAQQEILFARVDLLPHDNARPPK